MKNMDGISADRQHYLITTSDPVQREILSKIERASHTALISNFKIRLNSGYMTTIACVYTEALIKIMVKLMRQNHGEAKINFLDLFTVISTNRESDDADKDGNINIKFIPGKVCDSIMDRDYAPVVNPQMWKSTILESVQNECKLILARKHKIVGDGNDNWTIIAYIFYEYFFRTLKLLVNAAKEKGNSAVMINFLEMMEAHASVDTTENPDNPDLTSDKLTIRLRPGFEAKLLIKDDGVTEFEELDD